MNEVLSDARAQHPAFGGVLSVVPTPFDVRGDVDFDDLRGAVRFLVDTGVDGLIALGVTSEASRLTDAEKAQVLEQVFAEVGGQLPIVVGATTDGLASCVDLCRQAAAYGAAAVMVGLPRMSRMGADAVVRYYSALADAAAVDIVVQDYPAVSGVSMEPSLLSRLMREIPAVCAIKLEDPPTAPKIAAVRAAAADSDVPIFGGLGGAFLFEELLAGSSGAMTGFAYPELLVHVVRTFQHGRKEEAADIFYRYLPILRFEAQEGLGMAIRKEFLRRRGALRNAALREPAPRIDSSTFEALEQLLDWSGLVDPMSGAHPWN